MRLTDALNKSANNFDLLRLIAASIVIWGHAPAISPSEAFSDPILKNFGFDYLGSLAVKFFFFLSGLVVANSLLEKKNLSSYIFSRVFRIFPGLITCVLLTTVCGGLISTLSLSDYFLNDATITYVKGSISFFDMSWVLPGVFEQNVNHAVNGSLWTLPFEIACYSWLLIFVFCDFLNSRLIKSLVCLAAILISFFFPKIIPPFSTVGSAEMLLGCFFIGVFFAIFKDRIILSSKYVLVLMLLAFLVRNTSVFQFVFYLLFFYGAIFISTRKFVLRYLRIPLDISYGVYLYGYFIQQLIHMIWPQHGPYWNIAMSLPIACLMGYASFVFIERPMMQLGRYLDKNWQNLYTSFYLKNS